MAKWYLTNQSDSSDIIGMRMSITWMTVRQTASYKQQNKHMKIDHHLVCWERDML